MQSWNDDVRNGIHSFGGPFTAMSTSIVRVGTSATAFPNTAAFRHTLRLMHSGIVFVSTASDVKSGTGFILSGDPKDFGASLDLYLASSLSMIYGVALTSTVMTRISYS